jgi:hypothetical protein
MPAQRFLRQSYGALVGHPAQGKHAVNPVSAYAERLGPPRRLGLLGEAAQSYCEALRRRWSS